eukprot:TRINITY_DN65120_c0_g1_i3.p1 TRINITY_DN65120_c0_g1~~TRINITY_DN65120_c0_g1_i3.p1  ORF type:complete len:234 (-),score=18.04 TRINITY_DN65120_c0_g1_i3:442-1143(-)
MEKYVRISELNSSSRSSVWLAKMDGVKDGNSLCVIKEVYASQPRVLERAREESEVMNFLRAKEFRRAPSIKESYVLGEAGSLEFCLVMSFVPGVPLHRILRTKGRFNLRQVAHCAAQLCCIIEELHELKIAHRDIKASNLILDSDGNLVVLDFGFAIRMDKAKQGRAGSICGTAHAMAPEIFGPAVDANDVDKEPRGYDQSVDWWAYAVLLYELLCGFPPFGYRDYDRDFEGR